jgi:putative hydrolase of the HAD superfamily
VTVTTAVWFDCDGTLVEFDRPYPEVVRAGFERAGLDPDPPWLETYSEAFFEAFDALAPDPYRRGMEAVVERHGPAAAPEALADALVEAELAATRPRPGVPALLDALDGTHRLGVLTDGVRRVQTAKLERARLYDRFDAVVVSCDVGAHKPDPAIFDAAREALAADDHVMVGDSAERDVRGARRAGFRAVHVGTDGVDATGADGDSEDVSDEGREGGDAGDDPAAGSDTPATTTLATLAALLDPVTGR